ncbi:MAG: HEAT repeat domain-containing protein [bacterium]
MKKREWLGVSLILVISSLMLGCIQGSKKLEVGSREVKEEKVVQSQVKLDTKTPASNKEQIKVESEKTAQYVESGLSKEERKKIRKRILGIVDKFEKLSTSEIIEERLKKGVPIPEEKAEKEAVEIEQMLNELISLGKTNISPLIEVIKDKKRNATFRAGLIQIVASQIKDKRMINPLIDIAKDMKEDIEVRNTAASALKEWFGEEAPEVKVSEKEIKKIEQKVRKIIDSIDRKCKMIEEVGKKRDYDDPFCDTMILDLMIARDIESLTTISREGAPFMIEAMKDKNRHWYCRMQVFMILIIDSKDKRATKPAMEILRDRGENSRFRGAIVCTLSSNGFVKTEDILGVLKDERDGWVRTEIIRGLGFLGDEKAIESLVEALDDKDELVAVTAVRGLGEIGGEKVVEPLINALKNNRHALVRANASNALANTKSKRVIKPLIENLKKGDMFAAKALGELGKEITGEDKDRIVEALINNGLEIYKKYPDWLTWSAATNALGEIGDKRAVEPLLEALQSEAVIKRHPECIIEALGKIGDERAIEPLEKALKDERYKNAKNNLIYVLQKLTGKKYK